MNGARRLLIILGAYFTNVVLILAVIVLLQVVDNSTVKVPWFFVFTTAAIIIGTQVVFVIPLVKPPTLSIYSKSLNLSMLLAAFFGGVCTFVLVTALFSLMTTIFLDFPKQDAISEPFFFYFLATSWVIWSTLLFIFVKRKPKDARPIVRLTGGLFAGSLVELLLAIPLTVMVAKRSNCYCETGSYFALVLSTFASLWLFGPFMVILLVWRKRPWGKDHCLSWGYPRKVTESVVCSECGNDLLTQGE